MAQDPFVDEAFSEISEDERATILSHEKVVAALRSRSGSVGEIVCGDTTIKFRLSVNKKLRRKLALYKTRSDDLATAPIEKSEIILYDIISSLCVEEPWTSPKTWSVYDDDAENYGAQEILTDMLKQITTHMEGVKNFRGVP